MDNTINKAKFAIKGGGIQLLKPLLFTPQEAAPEETTRNSYLGTPVYSNLEIPSGNYKDNDGNIVPYEGIRIDTVLFDVSIEKNIVTTPINGRDGTVKQFISMGDYQINVQGILTGTTTEGNGSFTVANTYEDYVPEEEIRKLNELIKIPTSLEVYSEFLDFMDISTVVIQGGNIAQREGFRDSVYFSLGFLSDAPIELK